jgi:hypothetical protein
MLLGGQSKATIPTLGKVAVLNRRGHKFTEKVLVSIKLDLEKWKNGTPKLDSTATAPAELHLTAGSQPISEKIPR